MKRWLIALATAAAAGAGEMAVHAYSGGTPTSAKGLGMAAVVGAIVGAITFLKTNPPPAEPAPK